MKFLKQTIFLTAASLLLSSCNTPETQQRSRPRFIPGVGTGDASRTVNVIPQAIPGSPRAVRSAEGGGYGASNVQAQLKIQVKEDTKQIKVIRDNTDPFVVTKPYVLKYADPYAVRSYLEAAVGAKSVSSSPAQATAVKYSDGTGVLLVSAEEYRFQDSAEGRGIDRIVASLDRPNLTFLPEADTHIYFPRISRAFNLKEMLEKVGSSTTDRQFAGVTDRMVVDAELNAIIVKAPRWSWDEMLAMLRKYDRPVPEVKISYRIIEIYAENDDRIGVDFQSWKNNDGVDLFSAGAVARRNWGTFFTSGVQPTGTNSTEYWNFNPKWNTRYLDFLTSIGKAKCLAQGVIVAQNRRPTGVQVNSGFFYDRTSYIADSSSIAEACSEFAYTEVNPNTIQREAITKIMPAQIMQDFYKNYGGNYLYNFVPSGYTMRLMGTQTTTNTYADASYQKAYMTTLATAVSQGKSYADASALAAASAANAVSPLSKYLTGYVTEDGKVVNAAYFNGDWDTVDSAPGIIHGGLQYPMVTDGFKFDLQVVPVVTGKASKIRFELNSISLLGWNSDGSARVSKSSSTNTFQIGMASREFVIGGLRKSESVRGTAGLPFFKDLPVIGRIFSTESESIKQSQLVLVARIEPSLPTSKIDEAMRTDIRNMVKGVNKGMKSRVGNMFFQQYWLDDDLKNRKERLDRVGNVISDDYQEFK